MPIIRAEPPLPKNDSTKQIAVVTTGNIDQTPNPAAVFAWLSVCIGSSVDFRRSVERRAFLKGFKIDIQR